MKLMSRLRRAAVAWAAKQVTLSGVDSGRGWLTLFSTEHDLAWQADKKITRDNVLKFAPVYACVTLIASDIAKVAIRLMMLQEGVWIESFSAAFSPVLKKPNHYQTRQQFIETWIVSKLLHGNAYILKIRDARRVVTAMYVLDPQRVTPLVAPDGSVYYELQNDDLSKLPQGSYPAVPASEIIHDRMECLFHPLVGISPIFAAYLPASQGLRIQKNSEAFFKNMSRPSGILTAPGQISDETAQRLKKSWEENYGSGNIGKLAVLGDDLKYSAMAVNAVDAQLVEQLNLSAEQICSTFHVPAYMIGAAPVPANNNVEALYVQYYTQCLQKLFTSVEDLLDDGLGLTTYRTEFDLDDLLRMDSKTLTEVEGIKVQRGIAAPNEARKKFGLLPAVGGESPYLQQQNYSLAALAKRDAQEDPFDTGAPPALPRPPAPPEPSGEEPEPDDAAEKSLQAFIKSMEMTRELACG